MDVADWLSDNPLLLALFCAMGLLAVGTFCLCAALAQRGVQQEPSEASPLKSSYVVR